MRKMKCMAGVFAGAALAATLTAGENLVTVRVGEQDTCGVTGATTVSAIPKAKDGEIKFDLSKLPKDAKVMKALLRLWQPVANRAPFGTDRWDDPSFDGFKVWEVGGPAGPLATVYPFAFTAIACHEWDVTAAVKAWIADPGNNRGLKTNFPLPSNNSEPAWQRPLLELTYAGENPNRPPQPSELKAFHRSGQVFLTWKKIPHEGAFFDSTYRVYKSADPITAANLDKAEMLGEVHRLSQVNYRRTMYVRTTRASYAAYVNLQAFFPAGKTQQMSGEEQQAAMLAKIPHHYNFVIDDAWPQSVEGGKWLTDFNALGAGIRMEKGPELSDDTGLFVYTAAKDGKAFFAVTSVLEGNENRQDFTAVNAPAAPVELKVETPQPVLQVVFHTNDKGRRTQVREYVYWGGGADGLHVEPSTPFYFRLSAPPEFLNSAFKGHSWIGIASPLAGAVGVDGGYVPPARLAPFPRTAAAFSIGNGHKVLYDLYYGAKKRDPGQTFVNAAALGNFYGYHDRMNTGLDPRKAVVQPYLERRGLRELEYFFQAFPAASRDYVMPGGQGTALMFGLHYSDVFAQIGAAQERIWSCPVQEVQWVAVGKKEWKLLNDQKENAWDWMNPIWYAKRFPRKTWPFISSCESVNYDGSPRHWGPSGYPDFYLAMAADKRGGQWWWCDIGDAPNGGSMSLTRKEAYLAFANVNFADTPPPADNWRAEPRGSLNGYLTWHHPGGPFQAPRAEKGKPAPALALPLDMSDTPEKFEVAVRIGDRGLALNGQSVPPTRARYGVTDITPWRFQAFKVEAGKSYVWSNRKVATGQVLQSGVIQPDNRNLLTVAGFLVDRDPTGNKLIVEPSQGKTPAKVDESVKIGALSYCDYVRTCKNPVLLTEIKPPATTLTIAELLDRPTGPDGGIVYKGGGFDGGCEGPVKIVQPGYYVFTVMAKGQYGYSWPQVALMAGGVFKDKEEHVAVDSPDFAPYKWYAKVDAGKLPVRFHYRGDYEWGGEGECPFRGAPQKALTIRDVTFECFPEDKAANTPVEIRVVPRSIDLPAGMPVQFGASVINAKGEAMTAPIAWKCEGAQIDAKGVFTAAQPGAYALTAESGNLKHAITVRVADKLVDNFNEGGYLRPGWTLFAADAAGPKWAPDRAGTANLVMTMLRLTAKGAKSALVWDPGMPFTDYTVRGDFIVFTPRNASEISYGKGGKFVHGLVVRARDKDNYYRLEIERRPEGSAIRLIKRKGGQETMLAQAREPPPLAVFNFQSSPTMPHYSKIDPQSYMAQQLARHRIDRMAVKVRGRTIAAQVNGKDLFGAVEDGDLTSGAPGFYGETDGIFDNFEVQP